MKSHQATIGKNDEWLTPRWILEPLGKFDLDPCAPKYRPWNTADEHYTKTDNGLSKEWHGRVWCNPPFNRYLRPLLMQKMAEHGNGIMLIPANAETRSFHDHVWGKCDGILILNRRPHFCHVDGAKASANSGCTISLIAYGKSNFEILKESGLGIALVGKYLMARKRATDQHHALPKYVYIRRGWYIYRPHLGKGQLGKDVKLCPADAKISEVWQRYESIVGVGAPRKTLEWLIDQYLSSAQHSAKAVKTRKEYEKNANTLKNTPTKGGILFGQIDAERITPGVIRKYIDSRKKADGTPAPVIANREIAFLSICYSWAFERDMIKINPCKDVSRNSEKPRDRYVTDAEYQAIYDMAAPWPLVQCAMEFAYLCRMRLCEVLDLKQSNIQDNGLLIQRRKGSRDNLTLWNDRLLAAVEKCEKLPKPAFKADAPYLIRSQRGDRLTEDGFSTLWQRLMVQAAEAGLQRFTFHDLKAKGVSDTAGNKQDASGHKSERMANVVYNRKLAEVKPAGD